MSALEWDSRTGYILTEFTTFAIGTTVLIAVATSITVVVCFFCGHRNSKEKSDKLKAVFSLHRTILQGVFPDIIKLENPSEETKQKVTFLEYRPQSNSGKTIMVYVYFSLLSGLVALWFLAVFSDSLLYRKTTTCNDLSERDTDSTCFQISEENVPPEVQRIIDEEGGGLVPCRQVQSYIIQSNATFDLEVVCYHSQLSPLAAVGVAYGAAKSIVLAFEVVFNIGLAVASKGKRARQFLVVVQALILTVIILTILIVPASLHEVSGPRHSAFDYLRDQSFFSFAVIVLGGVSTIVAVGLHPWWAFDFNN